MQHFWIVKGRGRLAFLLVILSIDSSIVALRISIEVGGQFSYFNYVAWGPFLERPGNLPGPISDFGDKCFLKEVNFC